MSESENFVMLWVNGNKYLVGRPLADAVNKEREALRARAERVGADNARLLKMIDEAVDCWFNHEKRGDHAEMVAMYALRNEVEFPKDAS